MDGCRRPEPPGAFARRNFCDRRCAGRFAKLGAKPGYASDLDAPPVPIVVSFPGAGVKAGDEAPTRCLKPGCGGWLRDETVALACLQCGARVYVEQWLRGYAERHGFGGITPEVLGSRPLAVQWGRRWSGPGTHES